MGARGSKSRFSTFFKKKFFVWFDFWIFGIRFKRIKNDWLWLKNFFDPRNLASDMASDDVILQKTFFWMARFLNSWYTFQEDQKWLTLAQKFFRSEDWCALEVECGVCDVTFQKTFFWMVRFLNSWNTIEEDRKWLTLAQKFFRSEDRWTLEVKYGVWWRHTSNIFKKFFFEWFDFWILDICFKRSKMIDFRSKIFSMWQCVKKESADVYF